MHRALTLLILIALCYYVETTSPGKYMDILAAGTGALGAILAFSCCEHMLNGGYGSYDNHY